MKWLLTIAGGRDKLRRKAMKLVCLMFGHEWSYAGWIGGTTDPIVIKDRWRCDLCWKTIEESPYKSISV